MVQIVQDKVGMWVCMCGTKNIDPLTEKCELEVTPLGAISKVVKL